MSAVANPSRLLRLALRANAAFSTLSALTFLVFAAPVAAFVGAMGGRDVVILGVQLAVFAVWLWWLAARSAIPRWQVWIIIALDVLWVVGSFQTVLAPPPSLTTGGTWAIAMVADVVGLFALLQFIGLRRLRKAALPAVG